MPNQDENKTKQVEEKKEVIEETEKNEESAKEQSEDVKEEVTKEESKEEAPKDEKPKVNPQEEKKEYNFNVGDTIIVSYRIKEEENTRIQKFEGIVISKKGSGIGKTFTVRRIGSNSVGIERIFPLHSPNIADIEVKRRGKVRRSKLYYLRERKGKAATYVPPAKK